jgi:hypothetical protein
MCARRAAEAAGCNSATMFEWIKRGSTSYGYPLHVVSHQGRRLVDERDVKVMLRVRQAYPGPSFAQEEAARKRLYAMKLRDASTLTPAP